MRVEDIPQDDSKTYNGQRKVIYGTRNGRYEAATSTGWQDEAYATEQAVAELDGLIEHARSEVAGGLRAAERQNAGALRRSLPNPRRRTFQAA